MKGTAVYIENAVAALISNSHFIENGPVYAFVERLVSPYYKYLSNHRTVTYYNNEDPDEYAYVFPDTNAIDGEI